MAQLYLGSESLVYAQGARLAPHQARFQGPFLLCNLGESEESQWQGRMQGRGTLQVNSEGQGKKEKL